jgi:hypothetical protein
MLIKISNKDFDFESEFTLFIELFFLKLFWCCSSLFSAVRIGIKTYNIKAKLFSNNILTRVSTSFSIFKRVKIIPIEYNEKSVIFKCEESMVSKNTKDSSFFSYSNNTSSQIFVSTRYIFVFPPF